MVRVCHHGDVGSFKTVLAVREAFFHWLSHPDFKVYSNIWLGFPHIALRDPDMILDINKNAVVLLDELWAMADSRKGTSIVNDFLSMLMLRSRKRNWLVVYTQQYYTQTDIRIRFITELWISSKMIPHPTKNYYIHEVIRDKDGNYQWDTVIDARQTWNLFKTDQDPYTLRIDRMKKTYDKWKAQNYGEYIELKEIGDDSYKDDS